jgi:hypothetical protein
MASSKISDFYDKCLEFENAPIAAITATHIKPHKATISSSAVLYNRRGLRFIRAGKSADGNKPTGKTCRLPRRFPYWENLQLAQQL